MKKLVFAILIGVLCMGATNTVAQKQQKKESLQEKVLRLEMENQILQRENTQLKKQLTSLQPKPYYWTLEVQQKCEQFPVCRKRAEKLYKEDPQFQIMSIELQVIDEMYWPWEKNKHETWTRLTASYRSFAPYFFSMHVAQNGKPLK